LQSEESEERGEREFEMKRERERERVFNEEVASGVRVYICFEVFNFFFKQL